MNPPEIFELGNLMIVDQAAPRDIVNDEVERQIIHRVKDSIATAIEEAVMDAVHLGTNFMVYGKK